MKFLSILNQFKASKVMVIGDFMLDVYTMGEVGRISPEAPVCVLQVTDEQRRPGGTGNAILNLVSLGLEVVAVGRVGNDTAGHYLKETLAAENVDIRGIFIDPLLQTPLKNRVIASHQQIVRVDYEKRTPLSEELEQRIIDFLPNLISNIQVIAVSDYGKGFVTRTLFAEIVRLARENNICVIVDPKGNDFSKYKGAQLIKPNLSEALAASKSAPDANLDKVAEKIIDETGVDWLLITRSKEGMSLFSKDEGRQDFPVTVREVRDVTGAGDTVLAMITAGYANKLQMESIVRLANMAAGLAVERLGCARITLTELLKRLMELDPINKIFGEDHLFTLQESLRQQPFLLLGLSGIQGFTSPLFKTIQLLAKKSPLKLVVYLIEPAEEEFIHLLASLKEIDFIILSTDSLHHLCEQIQPKEIHMLEGEKLLSLDHTRKLSRVTS